MAEMNRQVKEVIDKKEKNRAKLQPNIKSVFESMLASMAWQ